MKQIWKELGRELVGNDIIKNDGTEYWIGKPVKKKN